MMSLINVSKRIKDIAEQIPFCETLYDVGCDHGKLGVYALQKEIVKKVVFSDISETNLQKAREISKDLSDEVVEFVCCDGVPFIENKKTSVVAICGLGAETIIGILNKISVKNECTFILQPATKEERLRRYLLEQEFEIVREVITKDGDKFYSIMLVRYPHVKRKLKEHEVYLGFVDTRQEKNIYKQYLKKKLNATKKLLDMQKSKIKKGDCKEDYSMQYKVISERIKGE